MPFQLLAFLQAPVPTGDYQWLASLGVGGVLAGGMFMAYRSDRKSSEERLEKYAETFMTIVQDNTKAMTSLVDVIRELKR